MKRRSQLQVPIFCWISIDFVNGNIKPFTDFFTNPFEIQAITSFHCFASRFKELIGAGESLRLCNQLFNIFPPVSLP